MISYVLILLRLRFTIACVLLLLLLVTLPVLSGILRNVLYACNVKGLEEVEKLGRLVEMNVLCIVDQDHQ